MDIDLKDKIDTFADLGESIELSDTNNQIKTEVIEAMTSLGYSASQALHAMEGLEINEDSKVEVVLKEVLKKMAFL